MGASLSVAYPSRPITVIVPFAAGGSSDVIARIVGEHMSRTLGPLRFASQIKTISHRNNRQNNHRISPNQASAIRSDFAIRR
jgi:hypothetical protein